MGVTVSPVAPKRKKVIDLKNSQSKISYHIIITAFQLQSNKGTFSAALEK